MNPSDAVFALLFVADAPVTAAELSAVTGYDRPPVEEALRTLQIRLETEGPIQLLQLAGGYQLSTKADYAGIVAKLLLPQRQKLSRSLMEVLAVVAYRQPATTGEIETVRGVDCSYGIRSLLERRLIKEAGRRNTPGRPIEYRTTEEFLHQFKMASLDDLPPLSEFPATLESRYNEQGE